MCVVCVCVNIISDSKSVCGQCHTFPTEVRMSVRNRRERKIVVSDCVFWFAIAELWGEGVGDTGDDGEGNGPWAHTISYIILWWHSVSLSATLELRKRKLHVNCLCLCVAIW